jgi:hypothetical protein
MTLQELELEKKAVLERIATHRSAMGEQVTQVRRSFAPMAAAGSVFRTILPLVRPLSGLARSVKKGRKRGIGTWFRVGLVAATLVPAVRALWGDHDDAS